MFNSFDVHLSIAKSEYIYAYLAPCPMLYQSGIPMSIVPPFVGDKGAAGTNYS